MSKPAQVSLFLVLALWNLLLSRTLTRNVRWVDLEQKDKTVDADENNATNVNMGGNNVEQVVNLTSFQAEKFQLARSVAKALPAASRLV